jgi:hypothetical protein
VDLRRPETTAGAVFAMDFAGASTGDLRLHGEEPFPGRHHFFLGQDQSRWATDVRAFRRLRFRSVYPGVDVLVREHAGEQAEQGLFEYDLVLRPGADLRQIEIRCAGIDSLRLDADGSLVLSTAVGELRQKPPVTWQQDGQGRRVALACRYVLLGADSFGFAVAGWTGDGVLTIDPGLVYSSYLGGTGQDGVTGVAVNTKGELILGGPTPATDYPTTVGAYQTKNAGSNDAFITCLSADGKSLVFSTYLGGSGVDSLQDIDVHSGGIIVATGHTLSADFPVTPGVVQGKFGGFGDVFVTSLSGDGKKLIFSTYLGGPRYDQGQAVHVDNKLFVTVAGTGAASFPTTTGAYQTAMPNQKNFYNPFVARLSPTGAAFVYSTYVGGTNFGFARAVYADDHGVVTVAGQSGSTDFPTTPGAYQRTFLGAAGANFMAFVSRLDAKGAKLLWSTYLGHNSMDTITKLHVADDGPVTVCGWTNSRLFPTTATAFQNFYAGGVSNGFMTLRGDGFISKLDATGSKLLASTFLGGASGEELNGLWVDDAGNVTVAGNTGSTDYPTTSGAHRTKYTSPGFPTFTGDAVISRLDASLSRMIYSSYFGGSYTETGMGVHLNSDTLIASFGGATGSKDLPLSSAPIQKALRGTLSGYATRLELLPAGVKLVGKPSPCKQAFFLEPLGAARPNDSNFGVLVSGGPANTSGYLLASLQLLQTPVTLPKPLGGTLYLPLASTVLLPATTNASGWFVFPLPIPNVPRNTRFALQCFLANTASCTNKDLLSSTAALDIVVQ